MTTLTANERIALNMIARNLYQPMNGARPDSYNDTSAVWSNCLDSNSAGAEQLAGRTLSATCASLAKKGLVSTFDDVSDRKSSTIELTAAGFDAWLAAYPDADGGKAAL